MLAHNLQRWPNIKPALVQRLVFAGLRSTQQTQKNIVLCGVYWNVLKSKKIEVRMTLNNLRDARITFEESLGEYSVHGDHL